MWWLQPRASKNMYSCPCVELLSLRPRISTRARRRRRARRIDGTTGGRADGGAMSHVDGADRDATRRDATRHSHSGQAVRPAIPCAALRLLRSWGDVLQPWVRHFLTLFV